MSKSKKASALQQAQEASAEAGAEVKDVDIDVGRQEALQALSMASNAEVKHWNSI
jgi:Asp-tRNA(Asn)/Glu-tRNA(Gln) amidotransferase A subunit family amidase